MAAHEHFMKGAHGKFFFKMFASWASLAARL